LKYLVLVLIFPIIAGCSKKETVIVEPENKPIKLLECKTGTTLVLRIHMQSYMQLGTFNNTTCTETVL
jgi:hypothetical protein